MNRVPVLVLGCLLLLGAGKLSAAQRTIRELIRPQVAVEDPAFERSLDHLLGEPFVGGNRIEPLFNGDEVFPAMLDAIRSAKKTITLENFIWSSGRLSRAFVEALSERARAGVKVNIVTDFLGSIHMGRKARKTLTRAGVELVRYNEPRWWLIPIRINHRTHRKVMVVDGRVGFIGGICISDKWLGNAEAPPLWRDNHFRVQGPLVAQLQGIICDNWLELKGRVLQGEDYFPPLEPKGNLKAQAFKSGPIDGTDHARLVHLYAIESARKSIRLAHSYFLPDPLTLQALLDAKARGVRIEVIAPGKIGPNIVQRAARSRWSPLIDAGIEFYVYQKSYYHCKLMIVDDVFVSTGSVNIDRRSFRINDEANINVMDRNFAAQMAEVFEADKKECKPLTQESYHHRGWFTKVVEKLAGLLRLQL